MESHRIEDALEAVKAAQDSGIVPGGGSSLLRASESLCVTTENEVSANDLAAGMAVVRAACHEPIRQMASNAGCSPDLIVEKVLNANASDGWDFRANKLTNLLEDGIIDPVKVTLSALKNAASCAGTLITTNYGIIQTEDK